MVGLVVVGLVVVGLVVVGLVVVGLVVVGLVVVGLVVVRLVGTGLVVQPCRDMWVAVYRWALLGSCHTLGRKQQGGKMAPIGD